MDTGSCTGGGDVASSIDVIVKSANQQFVDQTIQCQNSWTVKQLKEHLSEVYPCKLRIEEQKLIYSGKLLTDNLIIKDILRCYDEPNTTQPTHIFHLVYASKYKLPTKQNSPAPTSTATDGLRQRNVPQTAGTSQISANNCPIPQTPNSSNMFNFPGGQSHMVVAQQMAMHTWMQQVYFQYMNQYINSSSNQDSNRPQDGVFAQNFVPPISMPNMPYLPQHNLNFPANFIPNNPNSNVLPENTGSASVAHQQPQAVQQQQPPEPQGAAAVQPDANPRFPNIVQEEQEHRDWLDVFYMGCRLILFITLIYFYSSAVRCFVVISGAIGIYLYHNGFFRNRNRAAEPNNNNLNNNRNDVQNDRQQQAVRDIQNQQPPQQEEAAPMEENAPQLQNPTEVPETEPINASTNAVESNIDNGSNSLVGIIKTFVVTFFTSLLPDAQTL